MGARGIRSGWAAGFVLLLAVGCGGPTVQQTTTLPPVNPEAAREYNAATRLANRGGERRLRRAQVRLQRAIELDPNLWEAHYDLGVLQRRSGELSAAAASFAEAIRIQPAAEAPRLAAAELAYVRGDRRAAARQLQSLVESNPENLDARIALSVVLREDESWDEALAQAREVLVRAPENTRALLEIGRVYRGREQAEVSRLVLQKALALLSDEQGRLRAEVLTEQGLLELDRGDTQAAFAAFEGAIENDATFAPARMNMASVLLRAGDFGGAQGHYEAVIEMNEEHVDATIGLAIARRGAGDHAGARRLYEAVLETDAEHPDAQFNLAVLQADFLDERPAARARLVRWLSSAPADHPGRPLAERYVREIPAPAAAPIPPATQ